MKFRNLNLIWNELIWRKNNIMYCSFELPPQWLSPSGSERAWPISAFRLDVAPGEVSSPVSTARLVGIIRPASSQWSVVEWPESEPAGCRTGLAAEERGGIIGVGCSTAVQTERWKAIVVEQRSNRGHRQGGRGISWHRCEARGGVRRFSGGSGWRFMVAQRR
jgi:hypothetical protein